MAWLIEWLRSRPAEAWVTAFLVAGSAAFIGVQLKPDLLFLDTTPAGGDMGAHVWAPAYLRDELLPKFRLSGWAPAWYDGFPAFHFYMVVPSLMIVLLDVLLFLPYNVAFKLVSVSGLVAMPVAAWAMGRLARLPFPAPAALAVATVPFVFDRSFSIYGGNVPSTLAGEFAFSISFVFALLFLGVVLRGLETGRHRAIAAVLLGLTVLCHLIPAIFALVAAATALLLALAWRARPDGLRVWWLASVVFVGSLLSAFWTVPFLLRRPYLNDMGWEKVTRYWQVLLPGRFGDAAAGAARWFSEQLGGEPGVVDEAAVPGDLTWVIALAVIGVGTSLAFRRRFGIWLSLTAVVLAVMVVVAPQSRLWNARILPFWYLCLYFLAALAVIEIIHAIAVLVAPETDAPPRKILVAGPVVASLLAAVAVALPLRSLPFGSTRIDGSYSWFGITTKDRSYIPAWATWNYSGYERKPAYPEYRELVSTMADVGRDLGCGRAMWEYEKELDRFGTPMALMLLPYWTDGCIDSMEGLYFEASTTTPYHFLNQSELSANPSRAQRDLPYGPVDVALGVDHLQLLGVRYYLAFSDETIIQADAEPDLRLVGTSGRWRVYEVADSEVVQPLTREPVVVRGVDGGGKKWQDMAVDWYLDPDRWDVLQAADGPDRWRRVDAGSDGASTRRHSRVQVSRIRTDNDTIRFSVDRTGVPVLVKTSYFPNWRASGAEGPFRVAPNLMVVVPTDEDVTIQYGRTPVDVGAIVLTIIGIGLTVVLARRKPLDLEPPAPVADDEEPSPSPDADEDVLAAVSGGPEQQ